MHRRIVGSIAVVAAATGTVIGVSSLSSSALNGSGTAVSIASDTMSRNVASGLGTAVSGGQYTVTPGAKVSVSGGAAHLLSLAPGRSFGATLPKAAAADERVQADFVVPHLPKTGRGLYVGVALRQQPNGDGYRVRARVSPGGGVHLTISVMWKSVETTLSSDVAVKSVRAGQTFVVEGEVLSTTPVTIEGRMYIAGQAKPGWQAVVKRSGVPQVTSAGAVGVWAYTAVGTEPMSFSFNDLSAWNVGTPIKTPPPTTPPPGSTSPPPTTTTPIVDKAPTNVGVPKGAKLTKHVGTITVTKDGTVIDHMDIYGFVKVRAANVRITDSIIRGAATSNNTGMVDANNARVKNLLVQDSTMAPTTSSVWVDGIIGHDYTANRVEVYNTVDGFGVYNASGNRKYANVTIENSYVHDLTYFAHDPNHSDGTHNDGIQIQGGANINIIGNTIMGFRSKTRGTLGGSIPQAPGCGIIVQANIAPVTGLNIQRNLLDGSYAGIKVSANVGTSFAIGAIIANRLGIDQRNYGNGSRYQIRLDTSRTRFTQPLTLNVWAANGVHLAVGKMLGIRYG